MGQSLLGMFKGVKVCVLHPECREYQRLAEPLMQMGCCVSRVWPLSEEIPAETAVVVALAEPRWHSTLETLAAQLHARGIILMALAKVRDATVLPLLLSLQPASILSFPPQPVALVAQLMMVLHAHRRETALRHELNKLQARFFLQNKLNRAKLILMNRYGLSESAAHRFILSDSMNRRCSLEHTADKVIGGGVNLQFISS
ncbi:MULTISPECIES: ANTAR domain-containing response regulator [unclassified Brenneria]|uniref:ANTAR domain-containing response regulator n=1 Tax=unclassified Brenneria TaxID=2634434 RepID=UPI0018F0E0BB|nr:ANTAR domain-containing protein [Brenneria sp. L3-3C-1]MBJ7221267.1 ANTAR domain-containing protein [Brenneria sp. L3-3C-1]MEE3642511.1 ANTAR domain-containing protein [Brenneria sp. L3_3C_1]